ncbi:serine/threonine protein kinase [Rhodococcus sp. IEGM 1379]|uniref:serine/threonine protein kinase n=1 Tax=Rhodococcus sp. IEGM 1379 TaxID=3047086 RepID=UPI0024B78064|nr:serine/threonine protein kinase [Rhodococcus sp. IEGM 1379]MDI9914783.1 serine/threonine protein kinase [Rhodococcus sp. IEGM 1379]
MTAPQPPYPWNSDPARPQPGLPPPPGNGPPPGYRQPGYPQGGYPPVPPPRTPVWLWILLAAGVLAVVVVIALVWIRPLIFDRTSDTSAAATSSAMVTSKPSAPRTTAAAPGAGETLPRNASPCSSVFSTTEFPNSAVGSTVTSCEFAEAVRSQYVNQNQRGTTVRISAVSPITNTRYSMSCSGTKVVTCTGGNNAVVYVY